MYMYLCVFIYIYIYMYIYIYTYIRINLLCAYIKGVQGHKVQVHRGDVQVERRGSQRGGRPQDDPRFS